MCTSKTKLQGSGNTGGGSEDIGAAATAIADINGRLVLQPATANRVVPLLERRNTTLKKSASMKYSTITPLPPLTKNTGRPLTTMTTTTPPLSPKLKSPRQPAIKRGNDPNGLNSSAEKVILTPRCTMAKPVLAPVKKSKNAVNSVIVGDHTTVTTTTTTSSSPILKYSSASIVEEPGSIAAARREQVAVMQVQRKMRIAHYGRSKSAKYDNCKLSAEFTSSLITTTTPTTTVREEKRCSFITSNSDPIYVAYHDEQWGVPAHDDKLLFELLVLTGAQVGSDWTSVLKKRQEFREAFSGFDAETVSKFSEKKITSISADYGIELSLVRGVVDNSNRILEIQKGFGSFDKYLWGFVNHKPIATQYKSSHKMPVKTSKSESISKDMVRRGFRLVGPTVIHSFMQAAGLTNDHLTTCTRHLQCVALASDHTPTAATATHYI